LLDHERQPIPFTSSKWDGATVSWPCGILSARGERSRIFVGDLDGSLIEFPTIAPPHNEPGAR
jgi:hypothetical protein